MKDLLARWRRLPVGGRFAVVVVATVVTLNLAAAALEQSLGGGGDPAGIPGSSYTTAPDGLAAYADLLADRGHPVRRIRRPLADARLDPSTTVVVAGSGRFPTEDRTALEDLVERGGRLVVVGDAGDGLLEFTGSNVNWAPGGLDDAHVLAPAPENAGVTAARGSGTGSWVDPSGLLPIVGAGRDTLVAVGDYGAGRVVAVADTGLLENRLLAEADNATLGVRLVGDAGRPVQFAEFHNGYGVSDGLGALPTRWRHALLGLLGAALIGMWAWGKRLGPPQQVERDLPPPRVANVHALAASMARTHDLEPVATRLRHAAWQRLARRAGLPPVFEETAVRAAATSAGLLKSDIDALVRRDAGSTAAVAAGGVLARLEERATLDCSHA